MRTPCTSSFVLRPPLIPSPIILMVHGHFRGPSEGFQSLRIQVLGGGLNSEDRGGGLLYSEDRDGGSYIYIEGII